MTDFLLELLSEEVPARMQAGARESLARLFAETIGKAGLAAEAIETFSTPRRLVLIARGLPETTAAVREETKGPRASAPPQALEGFLRKTGLAREQLVERDGVLFAIVERPGRATADVLAEAIPAILRAFSWPKSMRWGEASTDMGSPRWVRPLRGIVALFGETVVPFTVAGLESGAVTPGHRFHHPGPVTIGSADDYAMKLRACHVILDHVEREAIVRDGAAAAAVAAGLALVPDEGLVVENAGLTEWPVPLLGRFDAAFLAVPREVIQLTMRTNQKYFACVDGDGALAPAFVCTANIAAADGGAAIVAGNGKVLAARLADARFFWEQDLRVPLADQARKLDRIVFHEKLGTVADKVERVAKLARWLVEEGIVRASPLSPAGGIGGGESAAGVGEPTPDPSRTRDGDSGALADMAEQAARLCKADLVTGMVGEFPELQGIMGGYYARAERLPDEVADAIRDHYKPVGQGDEVPTAPITVAVSLADKLDTLFGFFAMLEKPSGSRDPFALRRAALSIIRLLTYNNLRLRFSVALPSWLSGFAHAGYRWMLDHEITRSEQLAAGEHPKEFDLRVYGWSRRLIEESREGRDFPVEHYIFQAIEGIAGDWLGREVVFVLEDVEPGRRYSEADYLLQWPLDPPIDQTTAILDFFADRLKVQQREAGVRHDLIDAVFALGGEDDLVRLLARVKALQAFVSTEDGANLLVGYRRAANILRKEGWEQPSPRMRRDGPLGVAEQGEGMSGAADRITPLPSAAFGGSLPLPAGGERVNEAAEVALVAALDTVEPAAAAAVAGEDFEGAMRALAGLRAPVDAFFDQVTVNDPDPATRAARLALLARVRDAVHAVADFSRIEG